MQTLVAEANVDQPEFTAYPAVYGDTSFGIVSAASKTLLRWRVHVRERLSAPACCNFPLVKELYFKLLANRLHLALVSSPDVRVQEILATSKGYFTVFLTVDATFSVCGREYVFKREPGWTPLVIPADVMFSYLEAGSRTIEQHLNNWLNISQAAKRLEP